MRADVRRVLFLFFLLTLLPEPAIPQAAPQAEPASGSTKKATGTDALPNKATDPKAYALARVRMLAEHIERMEKPSVKIPAISAIAAAVCKHDKPLGQILFARAYALLPALDAESEAEKPPPGPGSSADLSPAYLARSTFYRSVARCDADFALRLRQPPEDGSPAPRPPSPGIEFDTALALLQDNPARASEFAARSIGPELSRQQFQNVPSFLIRLRQTNEVLADDLFFRVLAGLRAEPKADAFRLMAAGGYLFTFGDPAKQPQAATGMGFMNIGGANMVALRFKRPWANERLTRTYLETAADILARTAAAPDAQRDDYAAAQMLGERAAEGAPDLVATFELVKSRASAEVAERMRQAFNRVNAGRPMFASAEQMAEELEKTTDPRVKDGLRFSLGVARLQAGDFEKARALASDLEDKEARSLLLRAVDFAQTSRQIERGEFELAQARLGNMRAGLDRALLYAGLALEKRKRGDAEMASDFLNLTLADAVEIPVTLRANFYLALSAALAESDMTGALGALDQAVAVFNEVDKDGRPDAQVIVVSVRPRNPAPGSPATLPPPEEPVYVQRQGYWLRLATPSSATSFALSVKGLTEFDFTAPLFARLRHDAERAEAALMKLRDESRRGEALPPLAAAYLEAAFAKPAESRPASVTSPNP